MWPRAAAEKGHMTKTKLQQSHKRQSAIPEAFALATLASANIAATKYHSKHAAKQARKVAQLVKRGEL